MIKEYNFTVDKTGSNLRIDLYLKEKIKEFSRSQIQRWMRLGGVLLNGNTASPAAALKGGDQIKIHIPQEEIRLVPEKIPLDILYEDASLLVLNKPAGLVTHPGFGNKKGTLANAVAYYLKQWVTDTHCFSRMGLAHRLDKETSGAIVVAKNSSALTHLTQSFKDHLVKKVYRTIVCGSMKLSQGEIEGSIGRKYRSTQMEIAASGRYAKTDFKVLKKFKDYTYLEVYPKTGRTHQIRLHLAKIGYPILGDKTYGLKEPLISRQMLHAYSISFLHPVKKKPFHVTAPLPTDFKEILKSLENKAA